MPVLELDAAMVTVWRRDGVGDGGVVLGFVLGVQVHGERWFARPAAPPLYIALRERGSLPIG